MQELLFFCLSWKIWNSITRVILLDTVPYILSCSMTEDEVYQIMVVSNPEVMKQLAGCLQTPTFSHFVRVRVLCCLENLSYNSSTHKFICTPDIISAAINSPNLPSCQMRFGDMDQALCTKLECDLVRWVHDSPCMHAITAQTSYIDILGLWW